MRRGAMPGKAKVDARLSVARKSPKNDASGRREAERRLAEALKREAEAIEQQTATSELLKVIGRSTFDLQPVFETLAENAVRLCEAERASLFRFDGQLLRIVATCNASAEVKAFLETNPIAPGRQSGSARAALERRTIHIHDAQSDPEYTYGVVHVEPLRTVLAVPMLRADELLGVIFIYRRVVRPFTDKQIALMETFADQAAIAIENTRLFTELQASNRELTTALDQQTATSDILRVISQSQTDVQPVFDAIVASAVRLLGAYSGMLTRVAGDQVVLAALTSTDEAGDAALRAIFPQSLHFEGTHPKVIRDRAPLNIADAHTDPRLSETSRATYRIRGSRSQVVVPLLRHDEAVGALGVTRRDPGGFTDDEIALLQTFADQAVIAIENVRLFNELEGRNRDLTATSEILRVISGSPTDVQPVLDTVAESAARLCEAFDVTIFLRSGDRLRLAAHHGPIPVQPTLPVVRGTSNGRAVLDRRTVHVADMQTEVDDFPEGSENARLMGHRTILCVPLLREGIAIGTIHLRRTEARLFTEQQVSLLETFADQAVIAIENVRLFKELQDKNRALTDAHAQVSESLEQQTATAEILSVISGSPTDVRLCQRLLGRPASE